MKKSLLLYALITVLFLHGPAAALDVDNPPMGVFADQWYAVMLQGQKSGHMHSILERVKGRSGDIVRTSLTTRLEAGREGQNIVITMEQKTEETLDGQPLSFTNVMRLGMIPMVTKGRIKNGKVTISSMQFGGTQEKTYDLPRGVMMTWAVYREQLKRGLKPGTKYQLSLYEPTMAPDRAIPATVEILGWETIDLFGRKVEAAKARQTFRISGMLGGETEHQTTSWITDEGEQVRIEMTLAAFAIEIIACPKSVALAKNNPADLMTNTYIKVEKPINAAKAQQITYRIERKTLQPGTKLPDLPTTGLQKTKSRSDDHIMLTVTRHSAQGRPSAKTRLSNKERELYLEASSLANYKDPVVAKLIRQAAGREKDPRKLAERLCKFVSNYLRSKTLNVGFATASEAARSREGDCSEHGVLLAAMGRGVGIPSRVVTGLAYADEFMGHKNIFVGHLWTQFWIDGEWIDLDAALDQIDVDPTHIALGINAVNESAMGDMVTSLWLLMGDLNITPVSTK